MGDVVVCYATWGGSIPLLGLKGYVAVLQFLRGISGVR
jgi:hypothetical protein